MHHNTSSFEQKLQEEKALLLRELKEIGIVKNKKVPDDWQAKPADWDTHESDPGDVADRIESYENNTAIVNDLEQRLMDIDAALGKIKEGKYGICEIGGEKIEEDRLEANPAARTCKEHMNG
jgi:DnaK suppressor protein